ncbi:MAG: arsenite methyltransferase [Chloroflexi bacterium]|nr:arsenite methyltransferase [Chloroflexota bacterium]
MPTIELRDQVRDYYAEHARTFLQGAPSSCCGTGTSCADDTIPAQALTALQDAQAIPDEIIQTSLGCGTPLELAELKPGETVLDLGSGGGLDCFFAARLVGQTGYVIGVDMTPDMLALAEANKAKVGLTNVEFRRGYLEALPLDDASVAVIISNCVINLAADKDIVFREAFRVLKPGGRVVFSDIVSQNALPQGLRKNAQSWAECLAGAIPQGEYATKMTIAGFKNVAVIANPSPQDLVFSAKFKATKDLD